MQLNARQDPSNDSTVRSALIVDDDARLRRLLVDFLEQSNWQTYEAADGIDALEAARLHHPSIIILDLMMPRLDGMETCRRLRQVSQVPIIMLTARDDEVDKLLGLELGADDYLAKPFHLAELHARVKSVIRRHQTDGNTEIEIENLTVRPDDHTVFINGEELKLNRKEFDLLYYFVTNPNRLINKTTLAEAVWGDNIDQADSLDFIYSQVKNLRKKMKTAEAIPEIKAVYGFGYKLITTPEA